MLDKDNDIDLVDTDDDETEGGSQAVTLATSAHGSTPLDLARMGLSEFAYIRQALVNDVPMWTIHSAAGDPLGAAESFDLAWAAVKQNDLQPMRVH
jgi:hypothetical protein